MSDNFKCVPPPNALVRTSSEFQIRDLAVKVVRLRKHFNPKAKIRTLPTSQTHVESARFFSSSMVRANATWKHVGVSTRIAGDSSIRNFHIIETKLNIRCRGDCIVRNSYTDKIGGDLTEINSIPNFQSTQKLYPTADVTSTLNGNPIIDKFNGTTNLFENINEGIFTGNYQENFNTSTRISDDIETFIQPSAVFTDGTFRYKCKVTQPYATPIDNFLFMRASAPIQNLESSTPPLYNIHNIVFNDPSGNLITKYKDMTIKGDSDYRSDDVNYTTYIFSPEINNAAKETEDPDYPIFSNVDSYTLSFDIDVKCGDIAFNQGFDLGYDDDGCSLPSYLHTNNDYLAVDGSPLSTQSQNRLNPTNSIRITAIEIATKGAGGWIANSNMSCFLKTDEVGNRITREIKPSEMQLSSFDTTIYPSVQSTWTSDDNNYDNSTVSGSKELLNIIRTQNTDNYIDLTSSTVSGSGKLLLKFSHEPPSSRTRYSGGAFNIGYLNEINEFDSAQFLADKPQDTAFVVDEIKLKIVAKKDVGSSDYTIDVVGYNFDHLLGNTPAIGGFLQNTEGTGSVPEVSFTGDTDELGISSESISDKSQLVLRPITASSGGDHYIVSSTPVIDSTDFKEYIVPLKVYRQSNFGKVPNYNFSMYFENLFLDVCPLPDNAAVSSISLILTYAPSNILGLHTIGHDNTTEIAHVNTKMVLSERKSVDNANNAASDPLSEINDIPHGYGFPDTLKTNYSRRWRGVDGILTSGSFDSDAFDFSFHNPIIKQPFLGGYFSFNNDSGSNIISDDLLDLTPLQGTYNGTYTKVHNIGSRFKSASLFGLSTGHTTIDFTAMSGYSNHVLHGKIADSYDNALKVSGSTGYISFPDFDIHNGFIIFFRFSPDENMDFSSSTLFAKDDQISVGFVNNKLRVTVTDNTLTTQTIEDTITYDSYSYPLSIMITYVNNVLSLYTDNELDSHNFTRLRDSITLSGLPDFSNALTFGYNPGDATGFSGFITDIGISSPDIQTNATGFSISPTDFLDTIHTKYWASNESYNRDTTKTFKFINKDTDKWHLGSFQLCHFNKEFDRFTERYGKDFLTHRVVSDGTSYDSACDLTLPSTVDTSTSYDTQIENDFLRINLIDIEGSFADKDVFYAVKPRIQKIFPRGYDFYNDSVYVDTILEHVTTDNITWPDGNIGPKLIVSLYTTNKDNPLSSGTNLGLINRSSHYILPDLCIHKISSEFKFRDLINLDSDEWSHFDQNKNPTEFMHKYFADDVQKMFLQYDIVYPAGTAYDSIIDIYGTMIKFTDAYHKSRQVTNL